MNTTLLRAAAAFALLLAALPAHAVLCYAKPNNAALGNGSSWSSPMPLSNALGDFNCTEIWVARGLYKPGPAGDPWNSFVLRSNLKLYGGFFGIPGTEGDPSQRDTLHTPSILSGDIDGNDVVDAAGITLSFVGTNSIHVFYMDGLAPMNNTLVDGFTVTGGSGRTLATGGEGGGLGCVGRVPDACSVTLRDLRFIGNRSVGSGGAVNLTMLSGESRPVLDRILFRWCYSFTAAGGLSFLAPQGQGYNGSGTLILTRSTFDSNFAPSGASAISVSNATALLVNTTIHNVGASKEEARSLMYSMGSDLTLVGVTMAAVNSALLYQGGAVRVRNSIIWSTHASAVPGSSATLQIQDSIVSDGCPSGAVCANVSANDPLLEDPRDNGGGMPTILPGSGSSAIDAGDDSVCADPATMGGLDQRGVPRPQGAHCDIGAVEAHLTPLDVAVTYVGAATGGSVSASAPTPQYGSISNCTNAGGAPCHATYAGEPAVVTLAASVPAGQVVTWSGACRGYGPAVTVALTDTPTVCAATFSTPTVWTVQTADEAASLTSADCSAPGPNGTCATLRDAMNTALSGDIIRFAPSLDGAVIMLSRFSNGLGCVVNGPTQCVGGGTLTTQFGPSAFFISGKAITVDAVSGLAQGVELVRDPAQPAFRLFDVDATGGLNLYGLTLRNGFARGGSANSGGGGALGAGGAVFSQGRLTVDRCTFVDNTALGGDSHDTSAGAGGAGVGENAPVATLDGGGPNGGAFNFEQFGLARAGGFGGGGSVGLFPTGSNIGGTGGFGGGGGNGAPTGIGGKGGDGGFGAGAGGGTSPPPGGGGSYGAGTPGFGGGVAGLPAGVAGAGAGMGGAIFNDAGVLLVTNSTFTNNSAIGGGNYQGTSSFGGVAGYIPWSASGYGGAIFNYAGTVEISFATLHRNRVAASLTLPPWIPVSLAATEGGAIYSLSDSLAGCSAGGNPCVSGNAKLILNNSIATASTQLNGRNGDVSAVSDIVVNTINGGIPTSSGAGNLVTASAGFAGAATSVDPLLGTLIPGGGMVGVKVPSLDSPALEAAANCGGANGIDQTGLTRPQGTRCDAGAVEGVVIPDLGRIFANGFDAEEVPQPVRVQCSGATRDEDVLIEDFAGTAPSANWNWNANGGTLTVNDGVSLSSSGATFPFVTSAKPVIPAGDFSVRWRARYQGVTNRGTGSLVLSNGLPANGTNDDNTLRSAHAWADSAGGYGVIMRTDVNTYGTVAMVDNPPQFLAHDVEYCWVGGQIEVWVDGTRRLRRSNAGLAHPTSLWFGNPVNAGGNGAWSGFTLDHVHVRRVNP